MSEWIKCSEKMPEQWQDVLAWCGWCITAIHGDGSFITEDGVNQIFGVTHWMPLPAAPKEEPK